VSDVRTDQGPRSAEEVTASRGRVNQSATRSQHTKGTAAPQISGAGVWRQSSGPSGTHEPGEASPTSPGSHISGPGLEQQGPKTDPRTGSAAWSRPGPDHPAFQGIVDAITLALRVIAEHRRARA